jgi:hypothetical protein
MQALYLGCRKGGKFVLMINTHVLLIIIRVVGCYIKVFTGNAIRIKTHDGKPTDKNKISVKLTALSTKGSARYREI